MVLWPFFVESSTETGGGDVEVLCDLENLHWHSVAPIYKSKKEEDKGNMVKCMMTQRPHEDNLSLPYHLPYHRNTLKLLKL